MRGLGKKKGPVLGFEKVAAAVTLGKDTHLIEYGQVKLALFSRWPAWICSSLPTTLIRP